MKTVHPITYSLKNGSDNSEQYYADVELFTARVLQACEEQAGDLADDYMIFLSKQGPDAALCDRKEYLFEFLLIGVYMREYGGFTRKSKLPAMLLMNLLAFFRRKGGLLKKGSDKLRGYLAMPLLMKNKNRNRFLFPSAGNFRRLLLWMSATGEFSPQLPRLRQWERYFRTLTKIEAAIHLSVATQLADWFAYAAEQALGMYTPQVERFQENVSQTHKGREDAISVNKTGIEYHMNMVGAVVMNQVYAVQFYQKHEKVLLVPPCMRAKPLVCRSEKSELGNVCKECNPHCEIARLNQQGKQHGFEVVIMHHASQPPVWLKDPVKRADKGIVGVACTLNLISGGWTIAALGVPAQCVVLDHCGCGHWHPDGIATTLNENELIRRISGNEQTFCPALEFHQMEVLECCME